MSDVFYADLLRRWTDLRQDVDVALSEAEFKETTMTESEKQLLERRYTELLAKKNALNALDFAPNKKLLDECLIAEEHFRGVDDDKQPIKKPAKVSEKSASLH